ncbi:MAG: 3'-5' exonuclease, partial [candidate division Zixibacteria bacterium]
PKRGIGNKTVEQLSALATHNNISRYETMLAIDNYPELAGKAARLKLFAEMMEKYRAQLENQNVELLLQDLITELKLIEQLTADDDVQGRVRVENIEAFIEGAADFSHSRSGVTLAEYLAEISLFTDLDNFAGIDDKVTMMTLHSAKGLEFQSVYLVGLEEGLFPLTRSLSDPVELEEERRLFYVGATRACRNLFLSSATSRFRFGEVLSMPSRFIKEIPSELIEVQDFRTRPQMSSMTSARPTPKPARSVVPDGELQYEYEDEYRFQSGRIVKHPTFGRGKIISVEGFGESTRLEIMFTGIGMKKIMAKYAKLTVVG